MNNYYGESSHTLPSFYQDDPSSSSVSSAIVSSAAPPMLDQLLAEEDPNNNNLNLMSGSVPGPWASSDHHRNSAYTASSDGMSYNQSYPSHMPAYISGSELSPQAIPRQASMSVASLPLLKPPQSSLLKRVRGEDDSNSIEPESTISNGCMNPADSFRNYSYYSNDPSPSQPSPASGSSSSAPPTGFMVENGTHSNQTEFPLPTTLDPTASPSDNDDEYDPDETGPMEMGEQVLRLGNVKRGIKQQSVDPLAGPSKQAKKRKSPNTTSAQQRLLADVSPDEDGKATGRKKIQIEFIQDKSRRHITFSKRKAGIMKKAYELSTLTGTQVLLLVVSETGTVFTYTTSKLQPLVAEEAGKNLIQECLDAPDPDTNGRALPSPSGEPKHGGTVALKTKQSPANRRPSSSNLRTRKSTGNLKSPTALKPAGMQLVSPPPVPQMSLAQQQQVAMEQEQAEHNRMQEMRTFYQQQSQQQQQVYSTPHATQDYKPIYLPTMSSAT